MNSQLINSYKVQTIVEASSSVNKSQLFGNPLTKVMLFLLHDLTKMKYVGIEKTPHLSLSVFLINICITMTTNEKRRPLQKCLAPTH
jgi:hypothetical protein